MIKNVIFDIGNVLVDFRWRDLMETLGIGKEEQVIFEHSVFGSRWWKELDHGVMDEQEAVENIRRDNEKYLEAFNLVWEHFDELVEPFDYALPWIEGLKSKGYQVYLLSNYPKTLFETHEEKGKFPFLSAVDGKIVSAFVKMVKPNADIYQCLLNTYQLKAEECVFIDDRPENIEGAKALGMQGIVFYNYEQACKELEQMKTCAIGRA